MFKDRKEAGQLLAKQLAQYKGKKDVLVLGIPRGGVQVAYEVSKALNLPLDVLVIKKIGFPGNEELALGAASLDDYYINQGLAQESQISQSYIDAQVKLKQQEVKERYQELRGNKPIYSVKNKTIILIDDGVATGATMIMAIQILKKQAPKKIIVAVPVAPPETVIKLKLIADEVVCLLEPANLMAIGQFYENFEQVETEEVKKCLS